MFLLHIVIIALVTALLIGFAFLASKKDKKAKKAGNYDSLWELVKVFAWIFAVISAIILIISLAPFNPKYWFLTETSGQVTTVQTQTVVTGSKSDAQLTPRFVLTLDDKTEVILDDPRVQNVKVGDEVSLNCSYEWVYGGSDKQNCILR